MRTCKSCNSCIVIKETFPFGQCVFFPSGVRNVNMLTEYCCNHSEDREEDEEALKEYYRNKAKRRK